MPEITIEPAAIELADSDESEAKFAVRVTNSGTAKLAFEPPQSITLRRKDALAKSVRRAFKDARGDFAARLIALGDDLRSSSVEVPITYRGALGDLEPGETGEIELRLRVPDEIDRSVAWVGSLTLSGDSALRISTGPITSAKDK